MQEPPAKKPATDFDEFDDDEMPEDDILAGRDNPPQNSANVANSKSSSDTQSSGEPTAKKLVTDCDDLPEDDVLASLDNLPENSVDVTKSKSNVNTQLDAVSESEGGDQNVPPTNSLDSEDEEMVIDESREVNGDVNKLVSNESINQTSSSVEGSYQNIVEMSSQNSTDNDINLQINDDSDVEESLKNDETKCKSILKDSGNTTLSDVQSTNHNNIEANVPNSDDNDINLQIDDDSDVEDENNANNVSSQNSTLSGDLNRKKSDGNESSLLNVSLDSEMPQLVLTEEEEEEI